MNKNNKENGAKEFVKSIMEFAGCFDEMSKEDIKKL